MKPIVLLVLLVPLAFAPGPARANCFFCDGDGSCAWPETCSTCPDDCGTCEIGRYTEQRARFVDPACAHNGDGLVDACADADGAPGRFRELQDALDDLQAGDTLYMHPGDYWRVVDPPPRDSGGIFTIGEVSGTAAQPLIITAADRDDPPVLHSCDPQDPSDCPGAALAAYSDHIILDHLVVRGRLQVWGGAHKVMQYIECTHGWGACDGNWSCLRIESCEDCIAHHNHVHDVLDEPGRCDGSSHPPRETGLKEFQSTRAIWEYNTVRGTVRWAYDLHRNSYDPTVRFNLFQHGGSGTAIHSDRTQNHHIYGNVVVHAGGCIDARMINERVEDQPHVDEIHHNTCAFSSMGISTDPQYVSTITDNLMHALMPGGTERGNINAAGANHTIDHNAYDDDSYYHQGLYEQGQEYRSLGEWQAATGYDANSVEAPGGPCAFVDPPDSEADTEFDLHVASGACLTMGSTGGQVGAYGITECVGHLCAGACNVDVVTECSDGVDNDGDGQTDGDDTGCTGAIDDDESDCGDGACEGGEDCADCEADCGACGGCQDGDGDGYGDPASADCAHPEADCDDGDEDVHPGAAEACNAADDDCDAQTDEDWPSLGMDCTAGIGACETSGYVACLADGTDAACDAVPGEPSTEVCGNDVDEDCDGVLDNDCPCTDGDERPCYTGPSGTEGVGTCQAGVQTCEAGTWSSTCDGEVVPVAEACTDALDNDCDGDTDGADSDCEEPCTDVDGDGHDNEACGGDDCNDSDGAVHPGADEICDNDRDDDCDGDVDEDCADAVNGGCGCVQAGDYRSGLLVLLLLLALGCAGRGRRS